MASLEDKVYESKKSALKVVKELKLCEEEVKNLRKENIYLKSHIAIYMPVKDDLIDERLADYINN